LAEAYYEENGNYDVQNGLFENAQIIIESARELCFLGSITQIAKTCYQINDVGWP
jgi:hypothetical protein